MTARDAAIPGQSKLGILASRLVGNASQGPCEGLGYSGESEFTGRGSGRRGRGEWVLSPNVYVSVLVDVFMGGCIHIYGLGIYIYGFDIP